MPDKRRVRTPAERAQDALDAIDRQINRVDDKIDAAEAALKAAKAERPPLEKRREYLAANPDLPPAPVSVSHA